MIRLFLGYLVGIFVCDVFFGVGFCIWKWCLLIGEVWF